MTALNRSALRASVVIVTILAAALPVSAQEFPNRSIRMVLPFPAGGGSDVVARIIAQRYAQQLGQQVVVDNRAGASGNIAAEIVARAPADGYTVFFANSSISISPAIFKKINFDPVRDFAAISMASSYPFALVSHPALPVKAVKDLVVLAKGKPNALDYSSARDHRHPHQPSAIQRCGAGFRGAAHRRIAGGLCRDAGRGAPGQCRASARSGGG
jgi:tripartite-type tricarboxylate transporter receptor subunit TctC